MVDLELSGAHADGATPLDPDEAEGLLPSHITTRGQLDAWEQANILRAQEWALARRRSEVLSREFAMQLHRRMFDETWSWAGTFRTSDKNIGVAWFNVPDELEKLLADARYWLEHYTHTADEAAVRFHQRLVLIHAFPNGNGRHGRLMTDVLLRSLDAPLFSWGSADLVRAGDVRERYLAALKRADRGDYGPLIEFVRS